MKTKQNWRTNFLLNLCFGCFLTFQSVQTNAVLQIHAVFAFIIQHKLKSVQKIQKNTKTHQSVLKGNKQNESIKNTKMLKKWKGPARATIVLLVDQDLDDVDQDVEAVVDDDHVSECNSWYR